MCEATGFGYYYNKKETINSNNYKVDEVPQSKIFHDFRYKFVLAIRIRGMIMQLLYFIHIKYVKVGVSGYKTDVYKEGQQPHLDHTWVGVLWQGHEGDEQG